MATQNSINHISNPLASTAVTIDPGAAGDSYVQFNINTANKFRIGIDDTAGDSFKISRGNALGTNDTFVMTAAGERTMPLQPASSVYVGSHVSNVTGDGTAYTLVPSTEVFDQNGDFDGTSTFTSPVDGRYHISAAIQFRDIVVAHDSMYFNIVTSNRTYYQNKLSPGAIFSNALPSGDVASRIAIAFVDMDTTDTAVIVLQVSGGARVVDIVGDPVYTSFFVNLIC